MSILLIEDQVNYTSDVLTARGTIQGRYEIDLFIRGDLGSGSVKVLLLSSDGNYYEYSNLIFTENVAETLALKTPFFKIDIASTTSATVEVL